tara:strand:- start:1156 stop:1389 length:234 start_codon:yes stop_codon:yes gene_type:complete
MLFNTKKIDKILNFKSVSKKEKISRMLKIDADMYCNLGIDSSLNEKLKVKKNSRYIFKAISKIDFELGKLFLEHQDK